MNCFDESTAARNTETHYTHFSIYNFYSMKNNIFENRNIIVRKTVISLTSMQNRKWPPTLNMIVSEMQMSTNLSRKMEMDQSMLLPSMETMAVAVV